MAAKRYELSDIQWTKIAPLLPGKATDPGRTGSDNRLFVNGCLWVLRSGAQRKTSSYIGGCRGGLVAAGPSGCLGCICNECWPAEAPMRSIIPLEGMMDDCLDEVSMVNPNTRDASPADFWSPVAYPRFNVALRFSRTPSCCRMTDGRL